MSVLRPRSLTALLFGVVAQAAALLALAGGVTNATSLSASADATIRTPSATADATVPAMYATTTAPAASATADSTVPARSAAAATVPAVSTTVATAATATSHPFAAPQTVTGPTAPSAGGLAQVTFALMLVLVAIFAVAWVARRMRGFNNRVGDAIGVLADINLGQKERAVLLKVGGKQILVGVAPGHINTLHVLEEPLDLGKPTAGANDTRPNFKQLMLRSLGK